MQRNFIVTAIILAFTASKIAAQSFEIIPQINYTFGGKVYAQFGELKIQDSESYGLSLNIVNNNVSFQIEYFYQPTTADYRDYFQPIRSQNADLKISWYQIGVRQHFAKNEKVVPFGGLSVGLTNFVLESSPNRFDELALSFGLQAGANVYLSEKIGLRFHGRLLAPVQFNGFGFYAGTGGTGASASAGSYFVQADFGAGLIIRLSRD